MTYVSPSPARSRSYVEKVADKLRSQGVRVFYDQYEQVQLWGRDLYQHLDDVYQDAARYCVLFASKRYAEKLWTNRELRSAQARAIRENKEYILPAHFDNIEIPGLRKTVDYVDLRKTTPEVLSEIIISKFGGHRTSNFFPPEPDRLFRCLSSKVGYLDGLSSESSIRFFPRVAATFLRRTQGGYLHLPLRLPWRTAEHIHLTLDFLRRVSGFPQFKIVRLLSGMRSVGFLAFVRDSDGGHDEYLGEAEDVTLQ